MNELVSDNELDLRSTEVEEDSILPFPGLLIYLTNVQ